MTLDGHSLRARVLLSQGRPDLAERELRLALLEAPEDGDHHALLSLTLSQLDRLGEATEAARSAVAAEPSAALPHYALAVALAGRNHHGEARAAIAEAIRLDPEDADAYAVLAQVHLAERSWRDALAAADRGLEVDPDHLACTNLRAAALTSLGRRTEAARTIQDALSRDPEDPYTHANTGFAALHRNDVDAALTHFQEALRLSPGFEPARNGLLVALRAKNPAYRLLLRFFLWMSRLKTTALWMVLLAGPVGLRVLRTASERWPALEVVTLPLAIAYVVFVYLTWTADHLMNVALLAHPIGRHALTRREKAGAGAVAGCLLAAAAVFALGEAAGENAEPGLASLVVLLYVIPLSAAFRASPGRATRILGVIATVLAVTGAVAVAGALWAPPDTAFARAGILALLVHVLGAAATSWLSAAFDVKGVRS